MRSDVQRAIEIVSSSRKTHVEWWDYIRDYPKEASQCKPEVVTAGDVEHHNKCIVDYDFVLNVLQSMA